MKRDEKGRFLKGVSGNPKGKKPGSMSVVAAIRRKLEERVEGKNKTYLEFLVEKVMKNAVIDGDNAMIKDIIDRIDGKPRPSVDKDNEDAGGFIVSIKKHDAGNNVGTNKKAKRSVGSVD